VLVTDPNTVVDAVGMIRGLGAILEAHELAEALAGDIESARAEGKGRVPVRVFAGVWHSPMMGLGSESYGHSLLEVCGGLNVLGDRPRYPETSMDELRRLRPQLILLPDEPFPFDEGHAAMYSEIAPARVIDGKLLWWYGPRMPEAIRTLRAMLAEAVS
jgi:ABC-type hemin transport system substrate-binding protein